MLTFLEKYPEFKSKGFDVSEQNKKAKYIYEDWEIEEILDKHFVRKLDVKNVQKRHKLDKEQKLR